MTEGSIARWLKKEGETVKAGELLAEIETDKAVVEFAANDSGVLGRILVPDGAQSVPVGQVIALLLQAGEDASAPAPAATVTAPQEKKPAVAMAPAAIPSSAPASGRIFASPLARRIAAQGQIDLARIKGSGPRGRIVKRDVEGAATALPATVAAASATAAYQEIPNNSMRRMIARRLTEAKQSIPHFYLSIDCAIDALLAMRKELNEFSDAARLSVNDFVIKAAALALKQLPEVNASWTEAAIRRYHSIDVSVAVSTPAGLITPIIRNAERKGLAQISGEMKDLAERGRMGKLLAEEYQGGGFTISNLGMYGIREFAAIINPPQSCILAVGAGEARPVVKDGALAIATMMTCTLSADHRVVDGALGAEYLAAFRKLIEHPLNMLL
ncbi:dihydrolipoyllysine-residue acetyltransferase component of pyruvate dehydrogenase complex [mine drainage metagenome]|uniref:dihydrolipoyllysine-residue acetyltransferase n=1 Tax=mine drainage metagenome TaxID=410659 RepID=A0A1J5S5X4_9ZZZZ